MGKGKQRSKWRYVVRTSTYYKRVQELDATISAILFFYYGFESE